LVGRGGRGVPGGVRVVCRWAGSRGWAEGEFAEEFAGGGVDDAEVEVVDEHQDGGPADADVVEFPGHAEGEFAVGAGRGRTRTRSWVSVVRSPGWAGWSRSQFLRVCWNLSHSSTFCRFCSQAR
jgi:hypothetical protein